MNRTDVPWVTVVAVVALGAALAAVATGPAAASDSGGIVAFEPNEYEVNPGDTVEVTVTMRHSGGHDDAGVYRLLLRVDYPTEYLTVTNVEPGDWFTEAPDADGQGQESIDVRESVAYDDANGAVRLRQSLADPTSGVTGDATVATLTVEVTPDADAATVEMGANRTATDLVSRSDYAHPLSTSPATFEIAGGGEVVTPAYADDAFANSTGDADAAGDDTSPDGDDTSPDGDDTSPDGDDANPDDGSDGNGDGDDPPADETDDDVPEPLAAVVLGVVVAALLFRRR